MVDGGLGSWAWAVLVVDMVGLEVSRMVRSRVRVEVWKRFRLERFGVFVGLGGNGHTWSRWMEYQACLHLVHRRERCSTHWGGSSS